MWQKSGLMKLKNLTEFKTMHKVSNSNRKDNENENMTGIAIENGKKRDSNNYYCNKDNIRIENNYVKQGQLRKYSKIIMGFKRIDMDWGITLY